MKPNPFDLTKRWAQTPFNKVNKQGNLADDSGFL